MSRVAYLDVPAMLMVTFGTGGWPGRTSLNIPQSVCKPRSSCTATSREGHNEHVPAHVFHPANAIIIRSQLRRWTCRRVCC